jgi:hypothetical protein
MGGDSQRWQEFTESQGSIRLDGMRRISGLDAAEFRFNGHPFLQRERSLEDWKFDTREEFGLPSQMVPAMCDLLGRVRTAR